MGVEYTGGSFEELYGSTERMKAMAEAGRRTIPAGYPHFDVLQTRWADNDVYGHVNNVEYYAFFDTVINRWLISEGGLDIHGGEVIGVCAESHCRYLRGLSFPESVLAGLRVGKLGSSSVRYEIGLFGPDSDEPAAEGWFVHVFVDSETRRPIAIPPRLRDCLERLIPDGEEATSNERGEPR